MEMPFHHAVRGESLPQNFEEDSTSHVYSRERGIERDIQSVIQIFIE
jgi:hypothetical protein